MSEIFEEDTKLYVPFAHKDEAKAAGAFFNMPGSERDNGLGKTWFARKGLEKSKFEKWLDPENPEFKESQHKKFEPVEGAVEEDTILYVPFDESQDAKAAGAWFNIPDSKYDNGMGKTWFAKKGRTIKAKIEKWLSPENDGWKKEQEAKAAKKKEKTGE